MPAPLPDPVLAHAVVTAIGHASCPATGIAALRGNPGSLGGKPFASKILRYADEQTVAALAAVLQAIEKRNPSEFSGWGIVGAPRFLGRMITAHHVNRYRTDSFFGGSPHVIPNQCLHSLSGTVSVALGIRGPNYGAGGGPGSLVDGLLTAVSLLSDHSVPGVWLIASEFDPEPLPDEKGGSTRPFEAHALALALESGGDGVPIQLIGDSNGSAPMLTVRDAISAIAEGRAVRLPVAGLGSIECRFDQRGSK